MRKLPLFCLVMDFFYVDDPKLKTINRAAKKYTTQNVYR